MAEPHSEARGIPFARSHLARWAISGIATIASTYALDLIATASGVILLVCGVLSPLDLLQVVAVLAVTYAIWALALRLNLRANWSLLEQTGTSSNVFSKAAYDLTKARTDSSRVRRLAADIGYVCFELAKEIPYYLGAFGAAFIVDAISLKHAFVFLAGANLGAAAYEYGLARVVRAVLHHRNCPAYASFESDWVPRAYLQDYYTVVEPDEHRTIAFFVDAIRDAEPDEPVLYFGVGPALHHVFLAAGTASEIHLGDYLPANLREIERWVKREPEAHDWRPFVRYTLECEGLTSPTDDEITQREELTRTRISRLLEVDIRRANPLGVQSTLRYGTVISAYCVDSATDDHATWEAYMERVAGLVRPGGTLLTAALRRSRGYLVGGKTFPSANVDEHDIRAVLERHFRRQDLTIEVCELAEVATKGYSSIVLAQARHRSSCNPQMARTGAPAPSSRYAIHVS